MLTINGEAVDAAGQTLSQYLAQVGYDPRQVAVERNYTIVPKPQYDETVLEDGDIVEIVCFMGGG
jgi:sulfur carrier protein